MMLLRRILGDVLRRHRLRQDRTLRDVSESAGVSLGYLSEVERGRKEASSELLAAICAALDVPLADVLHEVGDDLAREERRHQVVSVGFTRTAAGFPTPVAARPVAGVVPRPPSRDRRPAGRPVAPVGPVARLHTSSSVPFLAA